MAAARCAPFPHDLRVLRSAVSSTLIPPHLSCYTSSPEAHPKNAIRNPPHLLLPPHPSPRLLLSRRRSPQIPRLSRLRLEALDGGVPGSCDRSRLSRPGRALDR